MKYLLTFCLLWIMSCNDDVKKSNNDDNTNTFYDSCTFFDHGNNGMSSPQFIDTAPFYGSDVVCGRSVLGDRDVFLWVFDTGVDPEDTPTNLVLKSDESLFWEVFVGQRMYDNEGNVTGTIPIWWQTTSDGELVVTDIDLLNTHPVFNDFIIKVSCIEDNLHEDFSYLLEVWMN